MLNPKVLCALAVLTAFALPAVSAGIIFNNGGPVSGSSPMTGWVQADDFVLTNAAILTDVTFWSSEGPAGYAGSITWEILSDNGGSPNLVLFTGSATPARTPDPSIIDPGDAVGMRNDFSVGSVSLAGGTTYWLALHNGPLNVLQGGGFYWKWANPNGTGTSRSLPSPFTDTTWASGSQQYAFSLTGANSVPEPAIWLLLLPALGGLVLSLRMRR